jgi:hypothetical protein
MLEVLSPLRSFSFLCKAMWQVQKKIAVPCINKACAEQNDWRRKVQMMF